MSTMRLVSMMLAVMPLPALAAERPAASASIPHADLDLTSVAGRAALDGRIRAQAAKVCRNELRGSAWTPLEMHGCIIDTVARARPSAARAIIRAARSPLVALR